MALPADLQNKGLKTAHANTQRFGFNKAFTQGEDKSFLKKKLHKKITNNNINKE